MAHKKAGGSSRNGRDSESKRLGLKKYGGQIVHAGKNVGIGKDHTLFAKIDGELKFEKKGPSLKQYAIVTPLSD